MIGGRQFGTASDPEAEVTASIGGRAVASWSVRPGFFVNRFELPAGGLESRETFLALNVTSHAKDAGGREARVSLEQFDLQSGAVPMLAFEDGWHEPEYNPVTAAAWRWMSDRAVLWIRPVGRDLTLRLVGESPLRYFDEPPALRVMVGGAIAGQFRPAADFTFDVLLPHGALSATGGEVVVTSDKHFVPGERDGSADRRRLALRIYKVSVR